MVSTPGDPGSGDSCGIVAVSMTTGGVVAVIADVSDPMTSDQWARVAVEPADEVGASEIGVKGSMPARPMFVWSKMRCAGTASIATCGCPRGLRRHPVAAAVTPSPGRQR